MAVLSVKPGLFQILPCLFEIGFHRVMVVTLYDLLQCGQTLYDLVEL